MDDPNTDKIIANQKEQEAAQLRKDESYNTDNPKVQADMEDAARGLEQDARALREEAAAETAQEAATESEEEAT